MWDGELDLPPEVEEELYHIAMEALNNALKHADPGRVSVAIHTLGRPGGDDHRRRRAAVSIPRPGSKRRASVWKT